MAVELAGGNGVLIAIADRPYTPGEAVTWDVDPARVTLRAL